MISIDEAFRLLDENVKPLGTEDIHIEQALGRVLAKNVFSEIDLPPFRQSAMDGYAFNNTNLSAKNTAPLSLSLVGSQLAGLDQSISVSHGECVRVTTGAPIPNNCNTVVIQENVSVSGNSVSINGSVVTGSNIRHQGEECGIGSLLSRQGEKVTPGTICALVSAGVGSVTVRRKPKITLVITGSELAPAGSSLKAGQTYNSNGPWLSSWLTNQGHPPSKVIQLRDNRNLLRSELDLATKDSDLIITTGGVSVGDADFIPDIATEIGFKTLFHKVAQKPGKPLFCGQSKKLILLGLPGNPGSTIVCTVLYVSALLKLFAAQASTTEPLVKLDQAVRNDSNRDWLLRSRLDQSNSLITASILKNQASHMTVNMTACNAVVRIPSTLSNQNINSLHQRYTAFPLNQ